MGGGGDGGVVGVVRVRWDAAGMLAVGGEEVGGDGCVEGLVLVFEALLLLQLP